MAIMLVFVALVIGVVVYYILRHPLKTLEVVGGVIGFTAIGFAVLFGVPWLIRLYTGW